MHLSKCHLLHNLHATQEDLHRRNREKIGAPLSRTPTRRRKKKTTQMRPNQLRAILIVINHSHDNMTISRLSLYHGKKNSSFNWVHSLHTGSMNASHSTNLFTNSCDHISTNGKAPLHSHINLQHPTIDPIG